MINYTNLLREHNLKATPQRLAITNILHFSGHVSIERLYEKMLKKFDSTSLAALYKNINVMLEKSFVQEVKIPNSKSVFELTKNERSHLVCENCGTIEDIEVDLNALPNSVNETAQFKINSAAIVLSGRCKKCQKTTKG